MVHVQPETHEQKVGSFEPRVCGCLLVCVIGKCLHSGARRYFDKNNNTTHATNQQEKRHIYSTQKWLPSNEQWAMCANATHLSKSIRSFVRYILLLFFVLLFDCFYSYCTGNINTLNNNRETCRTLSHVCVCERSALGISREASAQATARPHTRNFDVDVIFIFKMKSL